MLIIYLIFIYIIFGKTILPKTDGQKSGKTLMFRTVNKTEEEYHSPRTAVEQDFSDLIQQDIYTRYPGNGVQ